MEREGAAGKQLRGQRVGGPGGTGMLQGCDLCGGRLAQAVLPVLLFPGSPLSQLGQGEAPCRALPCL